MPAKHGLFKTQFCLRPRLAIRWANTPNRAAVGPTRSPSGLQLSCFRQQLYMSVAVLANDLIVDVLHCRTQFVPAVRTLRIKRGNNDRGGIAEWLIAVFALHVHIAVLRMNSQLFAATWTADVMSPGGRSGNHCKLRQGHECRNFNAVFRQF